MKYYWDTTVGRFRDEGGRFVSRYSIDQFVTSSILTSQNITDTLSGFVSNGLVTIKDWSLSFRQEIKDEYIRQYVLARGGLEQMTSKDWGSIGGMLKEQYGHLNNFMNEVSAGNLTEAQIAARSGMYINSAHEASERAREVVTRELGFDLVEWVIDTSVQNCEDCVAFSEMGIVDAASNPYGGAYPGSGGTVCLTNCHCKLIYSNSETGEEYEG